LAKHVLNSAGDELDFFLLGIVCQEDQYRMTGLINDVLGIDLVLSSFIPYHVRSGKGFTFSLYSFFDEELGILYNLVPNTSNFEQPNVNVGEAGSLFSNLDVDESVKLIKELPKTDYFLLLKGEDLHMHQFKVMERLKTVEVIVQLQPIQPADLPSRRNLIF
jgi:hypothetical protein